MHLILISRECEVHITFENKEYITSTVKKNKLTKLSKAGELILIRVKYSKVISSKFKVVKFTSK